MKDRRDFGIVVGDREIRLEPDQGLPQRFRPAAVGGGDLLLAALDKSLALGQRAGQALHRHPVPGQRPAAAFGHVVVEQDVLPEIVFPPVQGFNLLPADPVEPFEQVDDQADFAVDFAHLGSELRRDSGKINLANPFLDKFPGGKEMVGVGAVITLLGQGLFHELEIFRPPVGAFAGLLPFPKNKGGKGHAGGVTTLPAVGPGQHLHQVHDLEQAFFLTHDKSIMRFLAGGG